MCKARINKKNVIYNANHPILCYNTNIDEHSKILYSILDHRKAEWGGGR